MADEVIELGPLADEVIETILDRQAAAPLDAGLVDALRTALGPWFGNPGTAADTLRALDERGRLVEHRGRLCLRDQEIPIALPANHGLLAVMRRMGGLAERLTAAVAARGELDVDELPPLLDVLDGDLAACGRMLDLLVEAGVLVADGFRVRPACPALAAAVLELAEDVHQVLAAAEVEPGALAEHLAHVDHAPADPAWLVELARDVEPIDPDGALRHYVTALRFGRQGAAVLDRVLALTVRTGWYDWVHRIDETWPRPSDLPVATRAGLYTVSWLATVHTGRSLSPAACAWFDLTAQTRSEVCSIGDAASRHRLVSTAEMELVRLAMEGDTEACRARLGDRPEFGDLLNAGRLGDVATVLEIVLGERYQVPERGPAAVYQRLLRGYVNGAWTEALSAARELELHGAPSPRALAFGRLFAAEISALHGETEQARQWLADVTPDRDNEALHVWVRFGMLWRGGDVNAAVRLARQERCHDNVSYGLDRLLSRAATAGVTSGDRISAQSFLRALEAHRRADPTRIGEEFVLLARAMVNQDPRAAAAAVDLARDRNHTFDILVGQIRLGEIAEEPDAVLHEAYQLADRVGAPSLRELALNVIRARGLAMPHAPVRDGFTATELDVIAMVRQGRTNQQIASALGLRPKTVELYLTKLLAKTGTRSRVELIAASLSA
ncbi:helix-turn-helix transcriptional regulator [Kutzneria sp. CA-103260]|uniref:helix-turn-helix transcriptional regulator n=1 Tax=Kutzneria sp. CA-103260 TaxID=2802641 RepID=UPI001BABF910|nr:helix-turn-helix transcriptional regulator [Kutzneria sp. CA-103260]